jgi:hypothetical protein|tara:strand:+ start:299 stop:520 length:222 start_codon:yes stop_codon:yes gene_type:complete
MWNKIKKFFEPSDVDKARVERWREETGLDDKLTIEHFDKAVNPQDEMEEVQVTKHMSVKKKKDKKSNPVNYNF